MPNREVPKPPVRTVLWVGATAIDGVREHPGEDVATITVKAWL